jgi:hypothetical protein
MSVRGSRAGESAHDGTTLRRWVAGEPPVLPVYAGGLPFALHVVAGSDPSLAIVAAGAPTDADGQTIVRHAHSWLAMQPTWRRTPDHDGTPVSLVAREYAPETPAMPLVRLGKTGSAAKSFPYDVASARATLANAMRALSARVALREVVLTLPGA